MVRTALAHRIHSAVADALRAAVVASIAPVLRGAVAAPLQRGTALEDTVRSEVLERLSERDELGWSLLHYAAAAAPEYLARLSALKLRLALPAAWRAKDALAMRMLQPRHAGMLLGVPADDGTTVQQLLRQRARTGSTAIVVGVNEYGRTALPSLRGCVNDAIAITKLVSQGYGLGADNVKLLLNEHVSRSRCCCCCCCRCGHGCCARGTRMIAL